MNRILDSIYRFGILRKKQPSALHKIPTQTAERTKAACSLRQLPALKGENAAAPLSFAGGARTRGGGGAAEVRPAVQELGQPFPSSVFDVCVA